MDNNELTLLPKKTIGALLLLGISLLFVLHFVLTLPFLTTFGAITLLIIIALFFYRPLYGFLSILVLRTSADLFASEFSISLTDTINVNIASIFALLLITLSAILLFVKRRDLLRIPLLIPFGVFIIFTALTYIYSIDRDATFQETLRVLSIFLSFATSYVLCISIPTARKTIISTILLSAAIPLFFAVLQLVTDTGFSDNLGTDGRLFGTFKHPNSFASFLVIIIAILTYRVFSKHTDHKNKNMSITLLFFTIGLMVLTFSRGGWFAVMIFFGIFSLLRAPKILFGIAIISVILFFTSQTVHDRIEDIYNPPADSSIRWRVEQWKNALAAWQLSPTLGYGAGTEVAIHEREQGFYSGNPYTHNDFIKALQETGVVGFVLFALVLITTLILLISTSMQLPKSNDKLFALVITLLFIAEIGFSMSSNIWRGTAVQWLLWTLIACALSLKTKKDDHKMI